MTKEGFVDWLTWIGIVLSCSVDTLAVAVSEQSDTLEDVYEPYLIQAGFLERTGRGRQVTKLAHDHFKLPSSLLFS